MIVNYFRYTVNTRIPNFTLFLLIFFLRGLLSSEIFPILILDSLQKEDYTFTSIFINIFVYYIIRIYVIISSMISYTNVPIALMSFGFEVLKFIFIATVMYGFIIKFDNSIWFWRWWAWKKPTKEWHDIKSTNHSINQLTKKLKTANS